MAKTSELTYRQLEQRLSQSVIVTYISQLGHQPHQASCKLVDKTLTIVIQDSITKLEQLLIEHGNQQLAEQVKYNIQQVLQPQIRALIEEIFAVPVIEILSDSKPNTVHTSIVAILGAVPKTESS